MARSLRRALALVTAAVLAVGLMSVAPVDVAVAADDGPRLVSPASQASVLGNPVFGWAPVADASQYRFEVSTSQAFTTASSVFGVDTYGLHATPPTDLPLGTLHWRVAGIIGSVPGPYSVGSFTKTAGIAPTPTSPDEDAKLAYPRDTPLLSWTALPGVKSYEIELNDSDNFLTPQSFTTANTSLAITTPLTLGKIWYWRVHGLSATTGVTSAWSDIRTFTITWGDYEGKPTLLLPKDNAVEVQDVKFTWTGSSGPAGVPGSQSYQLQVSPNGDWANNITSDIVVKGTQFSPASSYPAGGYYWRVRAIATQPKGFSPQNGPWSDESQFTRGWTDKPVLTHPTLGAEVDVTDFHFDWVGVAHAAYYELQVGTDPNFSSGVTACTTLHTSLTPHSAVLQRPAHTIGTDCEFAPSPGQMYYWRVRGVDTSTATAKILGVWSARASFIYDQSYTVQISPTMGAQVSTPVLRWYAQPGYHKYAVTLTKNGDASLVTKGTTFSTSWSPLDIDTRKLGVGSYEWSVSGVSPDGVRTPVPANGRFSVVAPVTSSGFGVLGTNFGGQPNNMPSMTWSPITDASFYRVLYAPQTSQTWTYLTNSSDKLPQAAFTYGGNAELAPDQRETLPAGDWKWRVEAFNVDGGKIAESASADFTLGASDYVSYLAPADQASVLDVPQLAWEPAPDAYNYRVTLALDANFTNVVQTYETALTSLTPRESLPDNNADESYYWYVQVCKSPLSCGPGPQTAYEDGRDKIRSFIKKSPPPAPQSPTSGQIITDQVSFSWSDYFVTNPKAPGAKLYKIDVATDPTFPSAKIIDSAIVDQPFYAPWAKTYPDDVYYWRVQALDGSGLLLTSSDNGVNHRSFQKSSAQPTGLTDTVPNGLPTLTWSPLSHAGGYTVEIYRGLVSTFPLVNKVVTSPTVISTSYPAFTPGTALPPGAYSWRVRRNDVDGNAGKWANDAGKNSFTIAAPAVTLRSPADAAPLNSSDTVFTWNAVAGASAYRFETSTGASFSTFFESQKTVNTSWASSKYFVDGTTYRWRVVALDGADNVINISNPRTFTKQTVSVTITSSLNPSNSNSTVTLTASVRRAGKLPAGTVNFYDGSTRVGSSTLAGGVAFLEVKDLAIGTHRLTASWAGDASSVSVTSTALVQNVGPAGATYTPITPKRVMSFEQVGAGQTYTLALPAAPPGATAVALNVTAANPSSNTYVSVCPGGTDTATCKKASSVNPYQGKNTPNMVIVKLGADRDVTFYNDSGVVQLIADVQGWFVDGVDSGATYQPVTPKRVMAFTPVAAGKMVTLTIKGPPSGASAVALNVTAANPTKNTYISTCPGGTPIGTCKLASSLNPYQGANTPNMVIVKLGVGGTVSFYNDSGVVQLIADVQGWFVNSRTAGASYVPVDPTRSMAFQKVGTGRTFNLTLTGVPAGATAVALNLTSANQTKNTYVSVCPYGTDLASCKAASNLNPYQGKNIANLVVVKLGTGNRITFYNDSGESQLIADVQGWFVS